MPTLTAPQAHTVLIPPDLFAKIAETARVAGQDPEQLVLATLATTFQRTAPAPAHTQERLKSEDQPGTTSSYQARREEIAKGFAQSGMTEEELHELAVQSVKQVRAEKRMKEPR